MNIIQKTEVRSQKTDVGSKEEESRRQFLGELTGIVAIAYMGGMVAGRLVMSDIVTEDGPGWYPGRVVPLGDVKTQAKWSG